MCAPARHADALSRAAAAFATGAPAARLTVGGARASRLQRLAERAHRGDGVPAFVRGLRDYIRASARRTLGSQMQQADLDDLTQELTLRFFDELSSWQPERAPYVGYIGRALHWALLDAGRRARRAAAQAPEDIDGLEIVDEESASDSVLDRVIATRRFDAQLEELPFALAALPDETTRQSVVRSMQGARLVDIAQELGVHTSSVCRARQRGIVAVACALDAVA